MAVWLDGWAGDNAGKIVGRKPNTLLITASTSAPTVGHPPGLYESGQELDGGLVDFPGCYVECQTPNSRAALAININLAPYRMALQGGDAWEIELAELDLGYLRMDLPNEPWRPGVHLFSVGVYQDPEQSDNRASTMATAVIDDKVPRLGSEYIELAGPLMRAALRRRRLRP